MSDDKNLIRSLVEVFTGPEVPPAEILSTHRPGPKEISFTDRPAHPGTEEVGHFSSPPKFKLLDEEKGPQR